LLLQDLDFSHQDASTVSEIISTSLENSDLPVDSNPETLIEFPHRNTISVRDLKKILSSPNTNKEQYCNTYLSKSTLKISGTNRLDIVSGRGISIMGIGNSLEKILKDDQIREEIRSILFEAFNLYFVVDPTSLRELQIKFSLTPPPAPAIERSFTDEAIEFYASTTPISNFSDGVNAFTGIIIEAILGQPNILILDEPEAFLHPTLAFLLGRELCRTEPNSLQKNLFISTHSASFIMGCIQSGANINVVRLTYRNNQATSRLLGSDNLKKLMRNPLLRSTGVINALFYDFAIVVEADTDRAFYEEINSRLQFAKDYRAIPNCLFLNARNKQTVWEIVRPLREIGIPVATIVDIDIYKEGGKTWANFLKAGNVPEISKSALSQERSLIKQAFDSSGKDPKREGGVKVLTGTYVEAANNLFDKLDEYGLFVVRNGELESWLLSLKASGKAPKWLIEVFSKMGDDPTLESYVTPSTGDVWDFMGKIGSWLQNPLRKGV